jgi:hypothetical protein
MLWLTAVGGFLALATLVLAAVLSAVLGGFVPGWVLTWLAVLAMVGLLYALFGIWDWGPGGEARRHAVFVVTFVGLTALSFRGLRLALGAPTAGDGPLFLPVLVATLAVAGWLAYLGGLGRLAALVA